MGNYVKGDMIKDKNIRELKIIDEAKQVETEFGVKTVCHVTYDGQGKDDPDTWTINNTTAKLLMKHYGEDSNDWIDKIIPVEPARTDKGYAIYLDESKLSKGTL